MAEMRHEPTGNLAGYLLEVADDLERIAVTSGNLKGTYVRRLRDDAGKARASATELVKRTSAAGANVALEREILQLKARLQQATEENAELKKRGPHPETNEAGRGNQTTAPPKRQPQEEIHPKPPKQAGPGKSTRASKRQDPVEEGEMQRMAQEIKSLARQVASHRELVQQCINGERPANRKNATQQGTHTAQDREMREECSRAEGRGVLLAKSNTLRPAASARAEEVSP